MTVNATYRTASDLHDMVTDLTQTTTHRERYSTSETGASRHHITTVPSLLEQLNGATPASQASEGSGPGFGSRPAARIEAIDTLALIDRQASAWVRKLGHDDPGSTVACVRKVYALHAAATTQQQRDIETDVRHWWQQARIISGWDTAAWRPDNSCPICTQRRTLRIKLATHSALCVECRTVWTQLEIGLLAEHIRHENADEEHTADLDTPQAS